MFVCVFTCVCLSAVSDQPICGNQIVEGDEECDVGHNDTDLCCFSAKEPVGVQCRLRPGKVCRYYTREHTHAIRVCIKALRVEIQTFLVQVYQENLREDAASQTFTVSWHCF